MPVRNAIADLKDELTEYRRQMHQNPQTSFEEVFASTLVCHKLSEWGIPFERGLGKTGVVATLRGSKHDSGRSIGLRADMDALDIPEEGEKAWLSRIPGKMHGCGHDGHTAMLLGAAKYLKDNPHFNGTVHLIFQPAEETGEGAKAMMKDGLFERFPCHAVYGLHNWPYTPLGHVEVNRAAAMANVDCFRITITGKGGHASKPHTTVDPIVIAAEIITTLQTIISRGKDPFEPAVLSVTNINGGTGAFNVTPSSITFTGTVRTYCDALREKIRCRTLEIAEGIAGGFGAKVDYAYDFVIDATINDREQAEFCASVASAVVGAVHVDLDAPPSMGGEDFGSMLKERPGAYIKMGQAVAGEPQNPCSRGLHNAHYDFNDDLIPLGVEYWVKLVESALPLK